jgi:hypothetical protein
MGLQRRKKSGNLIGGSSLIVPGQPVLSAKNFEVSFNNKKGSLPDNSREKNTNQTPSSGSTSN